MSKTILVTGCAGFIGSNLVKDLIADEHFVYGLDNLSSGSLSNLETILESKNFKFIEGDINDLDDFEHSIDEIYNLACAGSPDHYMKDRMQTITTCSTGVVNLLRIAETHKAKFLQASTSEVYGNSQVHPQSESYFGNVNTVGDRSCYKESKRFAETLCYNYGIENGVDIKIARIFNAYGPAMLASDGRAVSSFIYNAISSKDLVIRGDGSQTRSFCYISDLVSGLRALMDSDAKLNHPLNIGSSDEVSILSIAEMVLKITGSNSKIIFTEAANDDVTRRNPDTSLAQELLNWEPKIKLEEGLKKTFNSSKLIKSS